MEVVRAKEGASGLLLQGIDPQRVPQRVLANGARMPAIGLGTFGSDHVTGKEVAEAVRVAAHLGYRHFDCASVYGNQAEIGAVFADLFAGEFRREEFWITSKLWNNEHDDVAGACAKSLRDLRLEYLDLYLVHWPFPNHHAAGCDVNARACTAQPYIHANYMKVWRGMEALVEQGCVRQIGTSNMTRPKLALLLADCTVRPVANEMELHPHFQQPELFEYLLAEGIQPVGFSPLGSPGRPERDRTPEDTAPTEDATVRAIAARHGIHAAAVCIKWAAQRGQVPIPFSTNPRNILSNLQAVVEDPLSEEEMHAMAAVDRNCRLIKGQVFLWKAGQSWEDLWDLHGEITPA